MKTLPLFENVPLVSTEVLGTFAESKLIGHHYGDLTGSRVRCIKITPITWLVGAHPWQSIDSCYVGGAKSDGFEAFIQPDADGIVRQYVQLTSAPAQDEFLVEVAGKGKMSSKTGRLLENPDEIIEDIALLGGRTLNFPLFREACNQRGLRIAGSVYEARSFRSVINEIVVSCGALWLADNVVFYPGVELGYAEPLTSYSELAQSVDLNAVAGVLGVFYGWNQARERNSSYIELTAVGCQYENKGLVYAKWLRSNRDAEDLARRILGVRAGRFVNIRATVNGVVHAGSVRDLQARAFSGKMLVTAAAPKEVETAISGQIILETFTNLKLTAFSSESITQRNERVDAVIDLEAHEVTLTVFDAQNRPMKGIFITLDGATTKKTDELGSATFAIATGNHTIVLTGDTVTSSDPYPLFIP
jgi:hypothetical protein